MTKQEWELAEKSLGMYSPITLQVDEYELQINLQRLKMKLVVSFYVNGWMHGKWLLEDCEERRRFFRARTQGLYKPKKLQEFEKLLGKRKCKEQGFYKTFTYYTPYWPSFKAFKSHLIKNNKEISLLNKLQEC